MDKQIQVIINGKIEYSVDFNEVKYGNIHIEIRDGKITDFYKHMTIREEIKNR